MGLFDFLKNVGSGILNTVRNVGGGILGGLSKGRDLIRSVSRAARSIPGVDALLKTKIPVIGESLDDLGNIADTALDTATDLGRRIGITSPQERLRSPD